MHKSICQVLLVLMIAAHAAEASHTRGRLLLGEVTYTKKEEVKGSTPAVYKSESKTTGEWTVEKTSEHKSQGPAKYSYKKTYPEKEHESEYKSEYKGTEQPKKTHKTTEDGKVFTYNSGKRHFEYTESTKKVTNFPVTEIKYSGGEPASWTSTHTVTGPVYEKKVSYVGSSGPSYKSEWTLDASKGKKEEEAAPAAKDGKPAAKDGAPAPKHHRRSL